MKHRCALVTCFPRKDLRVMNYVLLVCSENACPLSLGTSRDDKPKFNMSSCGFQKATKPHSPTPKASCSLKTRYFSLGLFLTVSVMQTETSAGISNMGILQMVVQKNPSRSAVLGFLNTACLAPTTVLHSESLK